MSSVGTMVLGESPATREAKVVVKGAPSRTGGKLREECLGLLRRNVVNAILRTFGTRGLADSVAVASVLAGYVRLEPVATKASGGSQAAAPVAPYLLQSSRLASIVYSGLALASAGGGWLAPASGYRRRHALPLVPECVHAYPCLCLFLCLIIDASTPDCAQELWWEWHPAQGARSQLRGVGRKP